MKILISFAFLFLVGCASTPDTLTRVDNSYICMMNNKKFDKKQIPITVNKKTYYGCCSLCKAALRDSKKTRFATDPVSGKTVDKSTAIVGANDMNEVQYFESLKNLKTYNRSLEKNK